MKDARGRLLTHYMPKPYRVRPERLSCTLTQNGATGGAWASRISERSGLSKGKR